MLVMFMIPQNTFALEGIRVITDSAEDQEVYTLKELVNWLDTNSQSGA